MFGHWSEDCNDEQVSNINIYMTSLRNDVIYMTSLRNGVICLSVSVSSIYNWSKNFSHSVNEKSEAKMTAIDVQ